MNGSPSGDRRPPLTRRLVIASTLTVLAVFAGLGVTLDRVLVSTFVDDLTDSLADQARAVRRAIPGTGASLEPSVMALGRELGVRITIIRTDGVVVADSSRGPAGIENHLNRPEVRAALRGEVGVASRTSETVGEPFRYVALPPEDELIVRVALPLSRVDERVDHVRWLVIAGTGLAALVGALAVSVVGRTITRPLRRMTDSVSRMAGGNLSVRVPLNGSAELGLLAETLNRMAEDLGARIEQSGREAETRDLILSAMEEGVVLLEPGGEVGFANSAAHRLLDRDRDGPISLGPAPLRRLITRARDSGGLHEEEIETGNPSRTVRVSAIPAGGRILLVLRDVTAARRLEAIRTDFVTNASHELKTPVASIQASAETMRRAIAEDPNAAARFAERLENDAVRLSRIVSDLLDLSRLETGRHAYEAVRLDLVALEESERLRDRARDAGITLESDTEPVTVRGSAKDLALLVGNLLDNAVRYTGAGGRVRLEVASRDGEAVVAVHDTGVGIPSRDLPRIFERFYRVDPARSRETGGTGLGLSIARHVTEQHGGRIEAESELGRGSTFRVVLPTG